MDAKPAWYNIFENLLRREVWEETNFEIKNIRYLTSLVYVREDNIPTIVVSLYANYKSGKIKLPLELTQFAWVSLRESKKYDLIGGIYEELEMVDRLQKGKRVAEWKKKIAHK